MANIDSRVYSDYASGPGGYNPFSGVPLMYQTGGVQGGGPTTGSGTPYGLVPNLPPYTTDTTQMVGTNAYPQLASILGAGYQGGLNQEMTNIGSLLKGIIPSDVLSQLYQSGAERGIGVGSPGSPNANAAMLRALGLTSLGLQEQGLGDLSKVIAQVPIQPSQTTTQTTDLGAARAGYAAAPDPRLAAEQALKNAMQGIAAGRGSVGAPQMPSAAQVMTGIPAAAGSSIDSQQAYWANLLGGMGRGATTPATAGSTNPWWAGQGGFGAGPGGTSYANNQMGLDEFDFWNTGGGGALGYGDMGANEFDFWNTGGGGALGYGSGTTAEDEAYYSDPYNWAQFGTGDTGGGTYDDSWLWGDLGYSE